MGRGRASRHRRREQGDGTLRTTGICIGASTVTLATMVGEPDGPRVGTTRAIAHEGDPRGILAGLFDGPEVRDADRVAVTGRRLRLAVRASHIPEPEALEAAYAFWARDGRSARTLVSAGGETFLAFRLDERGAIVGVQSGNKCASGTGEFFLQQLRRMDLSVEEALEAAEDAEPYRVAGRCSVFCKSDCTHALNKGAARPHVVAGLCDMMAGRILELLRDADPGPVLLVGGSSANRVMVRFLRNAGVDVHIPPGSRHFEAIGAALWAMDHDTLPAPGGRDLFLPSAAGFRTHPPLDAALDRVAFLEMPRGTPEAGDACVLGVDAGSTTTKAVLVRRRDLAILAGVYLRTHGDPVAAARNCYRALAADLPVPVRIEALATTGSGRRITGLHAMTPIVINEIIAHARAAAHFDPAVDTLFEIGGQDAKYTHLTHGVATDYAMNEACSAGTGSFLEESARESLGLPVEAIGEVAFRGGAPPDFNDQCAAFIGSDVKTAAQDGVSREDIAAGLVYSVCQNYLNRVKGARPVGSRILMQGGVCYNRAVPAAMAVLTGKPIVVPPEPGLMGAYGAALETLDRLDAGLAAASPVDLPELADRDMESAGAFTCPGGRSRCDRKCPIRRFRVAGRTLPFGGACSLYDDPFRTAAAIPAIPAIPPVPAAQGAPSPAAAEPGDGGPALDFVALRERLLREACEAAAPASDAPDGAPFVGFPLSLMTHTLMPLYTVFFRALGFRAAAGPAPDPAGLERKGAAFCWPMEQSHGALASLLARKPDILFLPHVKALPVPGGEAVRVTCPFVQSEPYVLRSAFPETASLRVLSPVLDMTADYGDAWPAFLDMARSLGRGEEAARAAFRRAVDAQAGFHAACRREGARFLADLENGPDRFAVVLSGRPYNAFASAGHMGIPLKFASRGVPILPVDFLPAEGEASSDAGNMYWASGQAILKGARFTARHPRLYGVYLTNFSCGPDSFLISEYRAAMGRRPSLTLELDSHTADAGIDTRIEAFLDVVARFRAAAAAASPEPEDGFRPARIETRDGRTTLVDSAGEAHPLTDPRVLVLVPSMGDIGARMLAAAMDHVGLRTVALPPPAEPELMLGRGATTCKECLPLQLTVGSLLRYLQEHPDREEGDLLVNFMPETSGPCRFGQYGALTRAIVRNRRIPDLALLSLTAENGYAGFGVRFALRAWHAVVLSDVLDDMESAVLALAEDPDAALAELRAVGEDLCRGIARDSLRQLRRRIAGAARRIARIPRRGSIGDLPVVSLIGEIYVRRDGFSRRHLVERLSRMGYLVRIAPVAEWIHYCDYIVQNRLVARSRPSDRIRNRLTCAVKDPFERGIRRRFRDCGFFLDADTGAAPLVETARAHLSPRLTGEAILTLGAALDRSVHPADGVLALGPFGCMPSRIAEALVQKERARQPGVPFLPIETDGNPFPPLVESRLEAFLLQVRRHKEATRIPSRRERPAD